MIKDSDSDSDSERESKISRRVERVKLKYDINSYEDRSNDIELIALRENRQSESQSQQSQSQQSQSQQSQSQQSQSQSQSSSGSSPYGLPPPSGSSPSGLPPAPPPQPPSSSDSPSGSSPSGSSQSSSSSYSKPIYSTTSDHKLVYLEFYLGGIDTAPFLGKSYNMSFLSDLGPKTPRGSEEVFLSTIRGQDRRVYWKNAVKLVQCFIKKHDPDIMFFQEMNDRDSITTKNPNFVSLEDGTFKGGYQALLEAIADTGTVVYTTSTNQRTLPTNSYYKHGSFTINGETYDFLAYSVAKGDPAFYVYPTVLTIWKTARLGEFQQFYGNDLGQHTGYAPSYLDIQYNGPYFHHGRNFSCVRTTQGANLVNIHGPNDPAKADTKLKPAIEAYLLESATTFGEPWNIDATVIGGDTNDAFNKVTSIEFNGEYYYHLLPAPITCCFENPQNSLTNYPYYGDKIYVTNPPYLIQLYEEYNCPSLILSGGEKNKYYRSLKKARKATKARKARKVRKARKARKTRKATKARKTKQSRYNKKKLLRNHVFDHIKI